jgi:hypothetical protein
MAISVPSKSAQYTNRTATPPVLNDGRDSGPLHFKYMKLTFTAAGFTSASAGDIKLERMPAGKVRIYAHMCLVECPVGTATSDFDLGYGAYVKPDGSVQAADGDAWIASGDVGGAALAGSLLTVNGAVITPAVAVIEIESKSGFDIVCSFDTANSPASGDLIVIIAYTHDAQGA